MRNDINRAPVAVILAAGTGARLGPLTDKTAKCLLSVGSSAILERTIRNCLSCGISQFVVVLGHRAEDIKQFVDKTFRGIRVTYVTNDRYGHTNTAYSLMLAKAAIGGAEFVKFDADVVFEVRILRQLLDSNDANVLCIDRQITLASEQVQVTTDDQMQVLEVGESVDPKLALGESIGIEKIGAKTTPLLFAELAEMMDNQLYLQENYQAAYARLVTGGTVFRALDVSGLKWTGIDTPADFDAANAMFGSPVTTVSRGQERAIDAAAQKHAETT